MRFLRTLALLVLAAGPALAANPGGALRLWVLDVGTGLAVYGEVEPGPEPGRPARFLYDLGKLGGGASSNEVVAYLTSSEVGLRAAAGDDPGDVLDLVVLSHPHDDHYSAGAAVFEAFDVRAVLESKQLDRPRYLERFKVPALRELAEARRRGHRGRYLVAALPYPEGFTEGTGGAPGYDELALCQANLPPAFAAAGLRCRVEDPSPLFELDAVAQTVEVPVATLLGREPPPDLAGEVVPVEVLPLGTRVPLGPAGELVVVHADTVAPLDPARLDDASYAAAFPYYQEADLNDGSLAVVLRVGRARVLIPGDAEGRVSRPRARVSLAEVFGSGEGEDAYTVEDVGRVLSDLVGPGEAARLGRRLAGLRSGGAALGARIRGALVTLDQVTPEELVVPTEAGLQRYPAAYLSAPGDVPDDLIDALAFGARGPPPRWREGVLAWHRSLGRNAQLREAHRDRFREWTKGATPRLALEGGRLRPEWGRPVWSVTNLMQLARDVGRVDPALGRVMAGMVLASDAFLAYVGEDEAGRRAARAERHMLDMADAVRRRGARDPLRSDVLVLGHHGSFTSSSSEFVRRVAPVVGIISADDRSYGGSTLPDFTDLFWNLNTLYPGARGRLATTFLHADALARARGRPTPPAGRSAAAERVLRARGRGPLALWRTDWNDDLWDANLMHDVIRLDAKATRPIWGWFRELSSRAPAARGLSPFRASQAPSGSHAYLAREVLGLDRDRDSRVAPVDPSGEIRVAPMPPPTRTGAEFTR